MSKPLIAKKGPYALELEPGQYWWCSCGRSQKQPFCDGSHEGTDLQPLSLKLEQREKLWLCGCKHTGEAPFCDGAHKQFISELNE